MTKEITVWGIEEETELPYHEAEIYIHDTLYQDKGAAMEEMNRLDDEAATNVNKYFSIREFTVVLEKGTDKNEEN